MDESRQHWLDRNRPPRVQITYDVETLGATVKQEIPFVVGVLGDFTGATDPADATSGKKLADRRFVEIDRDNFEKVMGSLGATVSVNAKLGTVKPAEGGYGVDVATAPETIAGTLSIGGLDDFGPRRILEQLGTATPGGSIAKLMSARQYLSELLVKIQGNVWSVDQVLADAAATLGKAKGQIDTVTASLGAFSAGATAPGTFDTANFTDDDRPTAAKALDDFKKALDDFKKPLTGTSPAAAAVDAALAMPLKAAALSTAAAAVNTVSTAANTAVTALQAAAGNVADADKKSVASSLAAKAQADAAQLGTLATSARASTDVATRVFPA
jgi:type VI secretion system protein ImpB